MGKYSFNFDYLSKKLDEIIRVQDDKKIVFTEIFLINDLQSILESAYDFNPQVPESQKSYIIEEGIKAFAYKGKRDGKELKNQFRKCEKEFLKKPKQKYSLLSSLSFPYFEELQNVRLNKESLIFCQSYYPKKYNYSHIYGQLESYSNSIPPHGYVPIVVTISARNNLEAVEKGLDMIDSIRGMLNYSINRRISSRIFYGKKEPLNIIRLGPTHTLHLSNGKLATELFWYEPTYFEKSSTWDVSHKWKYISKDFAWIRKTLNRLQYKNSFLRIFIRYARALDTIDYETSYLKLWSILELLTDTINSNYDKTITRALFFYKDDQLNKEIIEHLRNFRNKMVHHGETRNEVDYLLYQIKRIVDKLIWFHLWFAGRFQNIEEFGKFLDLSKDKNYLEKEIKFRESALRFLYKK
jgi:hypothetical protein